jgi:hypothetical protein
MVPPVLIHGSRQLGLPAAIGPGTPAANAMVDNALVALQASLGSRELGRVWGVDQAVSLHFLISAVRDI